MTIFQFMITGKHFEVSNEVKMHAQEKTAKLPRFYDSINQVEVIIDGNEGGHIGVEIIARAEHNKVFVVKQVNDDVLAGIDVAVRILEEQLRRAKGRERDNKT
jgi:ribosomal subunit interface protein